MKQYFLLIFLCCLTLMVNGQVYSTNDGNVKFVSDAPLEIIKAESAQLKGAFNLEKKTFAFKLFIKSFDGFNSPLQKEHFYENYLEVKSFPESVFKGKILEDIDMSKSNIYRAKGILDIHGVTKEVIIDVSLDPINEGFSFDSEFEVALKDYKIDLPRIVYQKIAEVINIKVFGDLILKE